MDFAPALAFYDRVLATGTNPAMKVGWLAGEGYQLANLAILCDVDGLDDGVSVLDVGCGLGVLVDYFARIGRRVDYTGVDISEKMIEAARSRRPDATFEVRDILASPPARRFDFVICSGTLNYRIPEHTRWMGAMIDRMYSLCDRAVMFNALSPGAVTTLRRQVVDHDEFVRVGPAAILNWCRRLTPDVELRDLWAGTFEVILRRPRAGAVAALARTLGVTSADDIALQTVIEYAYRRRAFAELRDLLVTIEPSASILEHLARAHLGLGERDLAIAAYLRAIAHAPTRHEGCSRLGRMYFDEGNDAEAQRWFREALARDHTAEDARYGLVLSLLRTYDTAGARAVALDTPPGPLRDLVDGRTEIDTDRALAACERALAAAPRFLEAIVATALLYESHQRWREAVALWERALEIAADDARIREHLVRARSQAR